jgi:hypothetical protein
VKKKPMTVKEKPKLGNAARNKSLSADQRKEIARRAAQTRWSKAREKRKIVTLMRTFCDGSLQLFESVVLAVIKEERKIQ